MANLFRLGTVAPICPTSLYSALEEFENQIGVINDRMIDGCRAGKEDDKFKPVPWVTYGDASVSSRYKVYCAEPVKPFAEFKKMLDPQMEPAQFKEIVSASAKKISDTPNFEQKWTSIVGAIEFSNEDRQLIFARVQVLRSEFKEGISAIVGRPNDNFERRADAVLTKIISFINAFRRPKLSDANKAVAEKEMREFANGSLNRAWEKIAKEFDTFIRDSKYILAGEGDVQSLSAQLKSLEKKRSPADLQKVNGKIDKLKSSLADFEVSFEQNPMFKPDFICRKQTIQGSFEEQAMLEYRRKMQPEVCEQTFAQLNELWTTIGQKQDDQWARAVKEAGKKVKPVAVDKKWSEIYSHSTLKEDQRELVGQLILLKIDQIRKTVTEMANALEKLKQ